MSRGHAEKFRADIAGVIEYAGHPMPIADLVPIALAVARAEWDKEHPPVGDQPMDPVAFRGMQRKAEETHQPAMAMALDAACRSWPTRLYLEDLQAGLFRALEAGEIVLRTHDGDERTASQISGALFDWIAGTAGGCHNTDRTFRGLRAGRPTAGAPAAPVRDPGEAEPDADRQCLAKLIEAGLIDETADLIASMLPGPLVAGAVDRAARAGRLAMLRDIDRMQDVMRRMRPGDAIEIRAANRPAAAA